MCRRNIKTMSEYRFGKKGLTLLEIIVATAILGIIAIIVWNSFSSGFLSIMSTGGKSRAIASAQTIIDGLYEEGTPDAPTILSLSPGAVQKSTYSDLISEYQTGDHVRFMIENKTISSEVLTSVTILIFYQDGRGYVKLSSLY